LITGHICFHDITECDARNYDSLPPTPSPTTDDTQSPTPKPILTPTKIPTEFPIPPPDPLPFPSDDPSDHWFCGIGIDDANKNCGLHCPTANECSVGQICYFGTNCDSRTFEPTPPPTKRPTKFPTKYPTTSPTTSMVPTISATLSNRPSASPTEPVPTRTPTTSPTKRPTFAPMPALKASFYCGVDWNYAITKCPKKCPSGEDPECPEGESCFAYTGCTEEMGYPEGEGDNVDGKGSSSIDPETCATLEVEIVADNWPQENSWSVTDESGEIVVEGVSDELERGESFKWHECINKNQCYQFTIFDTGGDGVCCEHGNGSYEVKFDGNIVKSGGAFYEEERTEFGRCGETATPTVSPIVEVVSDPSGSSGGGASIGGSSYLCVASPLVQSGYEVAKNKCDKFTKCYNQFIEDGDDWFCGENEECVAAPACADGGGGAAIGGVSTGEGSMSFRCVAKPLAEKGYEVSKNKCDLFDDCYNEDTGDGDDFFCDEIAQCVEAPACNDFSSSDTKAPSSAEKSESTATVAPTIIIPQSPSETAIESVQPSGNESPNAGPPPPTPGKEPSVTKPSGATKPVPAVDTTEVTASTDLPTATPMGNNTEAPTFNPTTFSPTYGPCGAPPCFQSDHCRSQYGFCGPGETYCNERATWTADCPTQEPTTTPQPNTKTPSIIQTGSPEAGTVSPVEAEVAQTLTESPVGAYDYFDVITSPPTSPPVPAFKKPSGGKDKPTGGSRPALVRPPTTPYPTRGSLGDLAVTETLSPTMRTSEFSSSRDFLSPTSSPMKSTPSPENANINIIDYLENPPPSRSPTPEPTRQPTQQPTSNPTPPLTEGNASPSTSAPTRFSLLLPSGPTNPTEPVENSVVNNGITCTGDPCPVETHCRSRYGSCGPGFIYCNAYTIWDSSCPPVIPGETPTRSPNAAPSDAPSIQASVTTDTPTASPKEYSPTFKPVPKPTLTTITDPLPLEQLPPSKTSDRPIVESDEAKDDGNEDGADEKEGDGENNQSNASPSSYFDSFQTDEYLDSWVTTRSSSYANAMLKIVVLVPSLVFYILIT